ncbi:MAG: hypothetical protein ACM3S5_14470 [Rhodospirillales bacterium]
MRRLILILMCVLIAAVPIRAKQKGKGKGESRVAVRFRVEDVREIRRYYEGRPSGLPPGLQKKLRREGRLPPGWEKKLVPFPVELERRLPPLGPGLRRGLFEAQAVIYDERTGVILDVAAVFGT